ncbi:MAG: UDP-2,4-diacetamido-2,4,6-trideoxy-beta-L-altropyranose hydrolase [bacterium]
MEKPLFIRVDSGVRIGAGHVMRCLALAQAWTSTGGKAAFITASEGQGLVGRLAAEGFPVARLEEAHPLSGDWETTAGILSAHPGAWVVLDGYHFDPEYQHRVREAGHPLAVIDDTAHLDHYRADILVNQNIRAETIDYSCERHTRLLLGPPYTLLRTEFLRYRGWVREARKTARRVLVMMGGSDPGNQTGRVIRSLHQAGMDHLEVTCVVGVDNPHMRELESLAGSLPLQVRVLQDPPDIPGLMAWADAAISGAGSTCWELAFMGLPAAVLVLADNQRGIAAGLAAYGTVINLGEAAEAPDAHMAEAPDAHMAEALSSLIGDRGLRADMSRKGRELIDGRGAERVVENLRRWSPSAK